MDSPPSCRREPGLVHRHGEPLSFYGRGATQQGHVPHNGSKQYTVSTSGTGTNLRVVRIDFWPVKTQLPLSSVENTAVVFFVLSLVIFYMIQLALTIRRGFSRPALIVAALVWMPPMVTLAEYVLVFMPITYSALVLLSVGFQWTSGELRT